MSAATPVNEVGSMVDASVCVLIPTYRQPGLLPEAVGSVLQQDMTCTIVLVNDGCPYVETHDYCLAARNAYPDRVLYVRHRNQGLAASRNVAAELALRHWPHTRAVFFLDSDNRLCRSTISRLYLEMLRSGADWVFPAPSRFGVRGFTGVAGEYSILEQFLKNYIDAGSLVSSRVLKAAVRFDASFRLGFEDWDFWLEAAHQGFRGVHASGAGFFYRIRAESMVQNSVRNHGEIMGHLRRKHARWLSPRHCVDLEHVECPRFALISPDESDILLFSDPCFEPQHVPKDAFLEWVVWWASRRRFSRLPRYFIVANREALRSLERARQLHGILWHLESAAMSSGTPVAVVESGMHGLRIANSATCLEEGPLAMAALENIVAGDSRNRTPVSLLPLARTPDPPAGGAVAHLRNLVVQLRRRCESERPLDALMIGDSARRAAPLTSGLTSRFETYSLFPLAHPRRRVGYILMDSIGELPLRRLAAHMEYAKSKGWSTHLFCMVSSPAPVENTNFGFDTTTYISFDTIAALPPASASAYLLGLVCTMDAVVNHACPEALRVNGALQQHGVRVYYSLCEENLNPLFEKGFRAGVTYEDAIDAYICDTAALRLRHRSMGVPEEKLPSVLEVPTDL